MRRLRIPSADFPAPIISRGRKSSKEDRQEGKAPSEMCTLFRPHRDFTATSPRPHFITNGLPFPFGFLNAVCLQRVFPLILLDSSDESSCRQLILNRDVARRRVLTMDGRGHKYQVGGDHENTANTPVAETRSRARSRHNRSDHIDTNPMASNSVEQHPDANQKGTQYDHFPSFSEQARSLGLCRDHSLENPLKFTKTQTPSETVQLDFTDPAGVSTAALLDMLRNTIANEKWDVDRESANFLADVATIDKHPWDPRDADGSQMSLRDLKIIEPVLTTDHELDMQRLGARNSVTISTNDIEPIPVDVERDEGLQWPSRYVCLPSELEANFASARLDIGKDVVDYLCDIAQPAFVNERVVMDSVLQVDKVCAFSVHP